MTDDTTRVDIRDALAAERSAGAARNDAERLARAVEGVWPVAADANEALEERDEGRGYMRLWPTDRLIERIAAEYARLRDKELTDD